MCGIAGVYSQKMDWSRTKPHLYGMQHVLGHRGPDDRGVDVLPDLGVGLVHTRLSVIDLSPAGHQPMWNDERTIGIVFNGEIYNFTELRRELESRGAVFRSQTDTEVIVKGYEAWGIDVVTRLNGMFAFAIWDEKQKLLWLARDRLGKKPLYYSHDRSKNVFLFASEIKALLEWPCVPRQVNREALQCYLALGYVPPPHTMFDGIKKLPAAHWLRYDSKDLEIQRYWNVPALGSWHASYREYCHAIRERVEEAVERRLVSDVSVGAFYSGGVDSSIVVGLMSRAMKEPVRTFSAGFEVGSGSSHYNVDADTAGIASQAFGTRHTRLTVRPGDRLLDDLRQIVWHMDEPHGNPTCATTFLLARLVKEQGITVALSGDGSDEIFGGYSRYLADRYVSWMRLCPASLRHAALALVDNTGKAKRLGAALRKADLVPGSSERYMTWWNIFSPEERETILSEHCLEALDAPNNCVESVLDSIVASHDQELLCYADMNLWQAEESNMRLDKMSMAHALEVRAPFQDYTVVEQAMSIPFGQKVGLRNEKRLLKDAFADLVPEIVLQRPKQGWQSPVYYWVRDILWEDARSLICSLPETGVFDSSVERVFEGPAARREQKIWSLMIFALWHQMWISGEAKAYDRCSA